MVRTLAVFFLGSCKATINLLPGGKLSYLIVIIFLKVNKMKSPGNKNITVKPLKFEKIAVADHLQYKTNDTYYFINEECHLR